MRVNKVLIVCLAIILTLPSVSAAAPVVAVTSPNDTNTLVPDTNQLLTFNVTETDGSTDLNAYLALSSVPGIFEYYIEYDLNLFTTSQCADADFSDATACYFDWNTSKGFVVDDAEVNRFARAGWADADPKLTTNPDYVLTGTYAYDLGVDDSLFALNIFKWVSSYVTDANLVGYTGVDTGLPTGDINLVLPIYMSDGGQTITSTYGPTDIILGSSVTDTIFWDTVDANFNKDSYTFLTFELSNASVTGTPDWRYGLNFFAIAGNYSGNVDFNMYVDNVHFAMPDGNYFLDVNVVDGTDTGIDSSDANFSLAPLPNNSPDINVTKIDGTDVNSALDTFSYISDANLTITFNVSDADQDDLNFNMWYSSNSGDRSNVIVADLNLTNNAGEGACGSEDWTSTVTCTYDFNIFSTLVSSDGNYFIDVVLDDGTDTDTNSSDSSFMIDNTKPFTYSTDINYSKQAVDANVNFTCSDSNSGCSATQYRVDTDGTSAPPTYGAWQTFTQGTDFNILLTTDGNWAIDINSTDAAGNVEDTNTLYVLIDSTLPIVNFTTPIAGQIFPFNTTQVTVSYTTNQAVNKYWVRMGGAGVYTDNSTLTDYNVTVTSGNIYTFYVIATDATDTNSQPATIRFEIPSQGGTMPAQCGNEICEPGEDLSNCPQDCSPVCGDGQCTGTESILTCPRDCAVGCGNKICEENETCKSCAIDCGKCPIDVKNVETILEKTIVQQPTQQIISTVLSSLGRLPSSINLALENHKKLEVSREILVQKEIETQNISSTISIVLKNTTNKEMRNVKVIDKIPKSVVENADDIKTSYFFAVLEEDPVVQFTVPSIRPNSTVKVIYAVNAEVKESQLDDFIPSIITELTEFFEGLTCEVVNCHDDNPCTLDRCYDAECSYIAVIDGTSCGFGKECSAGICRGIEISRPDEPADNTTLLIVVVIIIGAVAAIFYTRLRKEEEDVDDLAEGIVENSENEEAMVEEDTELGENKEL